MVFRSYFVQLSSYERIWEMEDKRIKQFTLAKRQEEEIKEMTQGQKDWANGVIAKDWTTFAKREEHSADIKAT